MYLKSFLDQNLTKALFYQKKILNFNQSSRNRHAKSRVYIVQYAVYT